jgi:hypothetical protein
MERSNSLLSRATCAFGTTPPEGSVTDAAAVHPRSARTSRKSQNHLVPRRSIQIRDGFGINSDLPRDPYVPWNRWWWTRIFDAGISFIRIGQYENSSDPTSWDWVERKRGEYAIAQEVDDQIDSLVENGVHIEIQLLCGNPLYTSPAGRAPQMVTPAPGGFHKPDRSLYSVFWPPTTAEQIQAFSHYARWMANHFRGRAQYYEIWNEPNIDYWNPAPSPEDYGHLFKTVAPAIRAADPNAKIVFGALAGADRKFAKRALDACACGESIDVFAYHIYPEYGHNLNPEPSMTNGIRASLLGRCATWSAAMPASEKTWSSGTTSLIRFLPGKAQMSRCRRNTSRAA